LRGRRGRSCAGVFCLSKEFLLSAGKRLSKVDRERYKYSQIRKEMTLAANAAGDNLQPWHKKLALWMADQVEKPSFSEIMVKAREITRQNIRESVVKTLIQNPVFAAFKMQISEEEVAKARAVMESQMPIAVKHHFTALDELVKAERWDVVYRYTIPVLDRVWPEDRLEKLPAQIVNVNIGGDFMSRHQGKVEAAVDITDIAEVTVTEVTAD